MHRDLKRFTLLGLLGALVLAVALAACGGGGSTEADTAQGDPSGTATEEASSGGADVAAAEELLAPYVGQSSPPFPVDEPLEEKPSADTKISQLQFESPFGALLAQLIGEAGEVAGVEVATVKAGNTASTIQSAAETILSQEPDVVLLPAAEPNIFSKQLKEMEEKGIKIFSTGVMEPRKWGIDGWTNEEKQFEFAGKLFAAWAVREQGEEANVVYYEVPELSFNPFLKKGFEEGMQELCPSCEARTTAVSATEIGNEAPNTVVSDLQAHPDTNQMVLGAPEISLGLPAALKAAQLDVTIGPGFGGDPQTLEYIKNGEVDAVLAGSAGTGAWILMDMALRAAQGQELTAGEKKGWSPTQMLFQEDITFDTSLGWTSEPEFMQRFAEYWHAE